MRTRRTYAPVLPYSPQGQPTQNPQSSGVGHPPSGGPTNIPQQGNRPQFGIDPATGRLTMNGQVLDRNDPRMYGSSGSQFFTGNADYQTPSFNNNPGNYWEQYVMGGDDNGPSYGWRLKPGVEQRLNGRVQLGQSGWAGPDGEGWNEFIDPNLLEWDDEFGILTPASNIRGHDPTSERQSSTRGWLVMAALAAPAIAAAMGGGAGASGGFDPTGGLNTGGPGWALEGGAGASAGAGAGSSGFLNTLGNGARSVMNSGIGRSLLGMGISSLTGGGSSGGGGNGIQRGNNGGGGFGDLGNLLLSGGAYARGRENISDYRQDMNSMIDRGMPVKQEDRQPYIDIVRGVADGTISPEALYDKIPGLATLSARGKENIGRAMSERGQGQAMGENAGWMREFLDYDKELTSKYVGQYLDQASKNAGYYFDPSAMMGRGLQGLGDVYGAQNNLDSGLAAALGRFMNGGSGSNGGSIWDDIMNIFGGENDWGTGGIDWTDTDEIYDNSDGFFDNWGNDAFTGP